MTKLELALHILGLNLADSDLCAKARDIVAKELIKKDK